MDACRIFRRLVSGFNFDIKLGTGKGLYVGGSKVVGTRGAVVADVATTKGGVHQVVTTVSSAAGGTAQTANCALVPAQSLILAVEAEQTVAMDGDTTKTFEVGVSGNADAYIDTSDFDPSGTNKACSALGTNNDIKYPQYVATATQVIATWTNTASATAGSTKVTVVYLTFGDVTLATMVNALNARIKAHGLIASS